MGTQGGPRTANTHGPVQDAGFTLGTSGWAVPTLLPRTAPCLPQSDAEHVPRASGEHIARPALRETAKQAQELPVTPHPGQRESWQLGMAMPVIPALLETEAGVL